VLKLNPVLLFGAMTGAGTITAALNALKEEADSSIPALGYTVPYALGNVILTVWGTVIEHLVYLSICACRDAVSKKRHSYFSDLICGSFGWQIRPERLPEDFDDFFRISSGN